MSSNCSNGKLTKNEGSFYTPSDIAAAILDITGYSTDDNIDILYKKVIDPAAGDGAILVEVAKRYVSTLEAEGITGPQAKSLVSEHIFAFELDGAELDKCKNRVSQIFRERGFDVVPDDLVHFQVGDAFQLYKPLIGTFDYVIGNPPYVRIHNLDEKPESPYIEGMCDLYYPFYDIGQQLLAPGGTLCYIAPSSWFTARAGKAMREDLRARQAVSAVCDFGHYQVFAPYATAYTAIIRIGTEPAKDIEMFGWDGKGVSATGSIDQSDAWVKGMFLPGAPDELGNILDAAGDIRVLNGYATNLDKVFISKSARFPGSPYERDCVKASKCEKHKMLYPYDADGGLLVFDDIQASSPAAAQVLEDNKEALLARTQVRQESWWQFGRTQGVTDTFSDKVAVQSLVKPGQTVKTMAAPSGTGVYGGVYVLGMSEDEVSSAVNSEEFFKYAAALRKYKSGGYYALGGKDIERFLNWWRVRLNASVE